MNAHTESRASSGDANLIAASAVVLNLFRDGDDSLSIAKLLRLDEPTVLRMLARARETEKVLYQEYVK